MPGTGRRIGCAAARLHALQQVHGLGTDRLSGQIPLEIESEFFGIGVATVGIFLQAFQADRFEVAVDIGIQESRRRRQTLHDLEKRVDGVSARNGGRPVSNSYRIAPRP